MLKKLFLIQLILVNLIGRLIVAIHVSTCYSCSSLTDQDCLDPFRSNATVSCMTKNDGDEFPSECFKSIVQNATTTVITRGCIPLKCKAGYCVDRSYALDKAFFCTTDKCNLSISLLQNVSHSQHKFLIFIAMLIKTFMY